jgi:hypothetical protein
VRDGGSTRRSRARHRGPASLCKGTQGGAAPHRIAVLDDLPRNLLGKVDKRRLRALLDSQPGDQVYEPPFTPTEKLIAEIWATALDRDQVSATDDFLRAGGSSLTAMEVISQVAERLGKWLRVRDLLDTTSLREFAERVDRARPTGTDGQAIGAATRQPTLPDPV